ncbi:hypothetical protein EB408_07225 [Campylobacter coli]|nr:hypothetical protein [Campylobacter coli]
MCKIIKYLDYARLNTLEKLYFDLTIMLIVTFLSFLFLVFEFFIYQFPSNELLPIKFKVTKHLV